MEKTFNILLVEDDLSLLDGLVYSLEKNHFKVTVARTVREAVTLYAAGSYDLILLDLTLPDGLGFQVCTYVRERSSVPIIFLTASDEEVNIVKGLDIGGDDYITKPFKLNELISRIKALLRRAGMSTQDSGAVLQSNGITIKYLENQVICNGETLELIGNEYKLLSLFMQHPNIVLSRQMILDRLWDDKGNFVDDNTLSVYVRRLRNKIEDNPDQPSKIITVRGVGYQWKVR
ncbi:MAG: response regulator transcription factor [Clostridiales bacterium]|nr:response regulator transcription factor [Clostridiales bacterium]MDU3240647.1 response regulator transcription factor [Clostridiales bacterium]